MAKMIKAATNSHHQQPSASFTAGEMIRDSTATAAPIAAHPRVLRKSAANRNVENGRAVSRLPSSLVPRLLRATSHPGLHGLGKLFGH
jgi:hypothetical protein